MTARYSREELLSLNQLSPAAVPDNIFSRLRRSGLCIHRPTRRSRKRTNVGHHQQQRNAKLCLINARSIINKCELLSELATDIQPDIIAITETWLSPEHGDHDLLACCPSGYSAVHAPRASRRGGGLALIFKTTITVRLNANPVFQTFELLDCSISLKPCSLRILVVYRPPSSSKASFLEEFASLLEQATLTNEKLLIVGDFNLGIRTHVPSDTTALRLLDLIDAFGLSQLVTSATHESGSILDLVIARASDQFVHATNVLGFFSDHRTIVVFLAYRPPRFPSMQVRFRRLRSIDPEAFAADIDSLAITTTRLAPSTASSLSITTASARSSRSTRRSSQKLLCCAHPPRGFPKPRVNLKERNGALSEFFRDAG